MSEDLQRRQRLRLVTVLNCIGLLWAAVWAGLLIPRIKQSVVFQVVPISANLLVIAAIAGFGLIFLGQMLLTLGVSRPALAALLMTLGGIALFPVGLLSMRAAVLTWALGRSEPRKGGVEIVRCLKCGYNLQGLTLPRCPECGVLRGFHESLDELGIRPEELKEKPTLPPGGKC